jgi:serine/threonine-protein kinase
MGAMDRAEESTPGLHASCPDAGLLVEFARGTLSPGPREDVLAHLRTCTECGEVLRLWTGGQPFSGVAQEATTPSRDGVHGGHACPPCPGDILAGKYKVERVLGIGGMGVVVSAADQKLGRTVAIKLMLPQVGASPEVAARFIQEARAAAELQSEHVARVIDVGELEGGSPFLVMEFLRGQDLARLLRTEGALPVTDVAGYVLQACEALAEAHSIGIVHRDLKPANLFLTTRADGSPLVKVLDFGISKLVRPQKPGGAGLTKSRTVMGTPLYMSPEQLRSTRSVGPTTDLWSLGCILYELLAGQLAFQADSAEALGALIATGPAPRICEVRPDVPAPLEKVILRCLEKDPADRLGSIAELARALGPFVPPDLVPLVGRIDRISNNSARAEGQLPYANTMSSNRPPALVAGTAASFARSNPNPGTRGGGFLRLVGGALGVAGLVAIGVYWRTASAPGTPPTVAAVPPPVSSATPASAGPSATPTTPEPEESPKIAASDSPIRAPSPPAAPRPSAASPRAPSPRPSSATAPRGPAVDPSTNALLDRK